MARSRICPKCQASMTEGFVVDQSYDSYRVSSWVEGRPEKSIWGLKMRGRTPVEIVTWRCLRCFYLESFAAP